MNDYSMIRRDVLESLQRYEDDHIPTGSFLRAVLENDLMEAVARADDDNKISLVAICRYVYNEMPVRCWGSRAKVRAWLEKKDA